MVRSRPPPVLAGVSVVAEPSADSPLPHAGTGCRLQLSSRDTTKRAPTRRGCGLTGLLGYARVCGSAMRGWRPMGSGILRLKVPAVCLPAEQEPHAMAAAMADCPSGCCGSTGDAGCPVAKGASMLAASWVDSVV